MNDDWTQQDLQAFAATLAQMERDLMQEGSFEISPNRADEYAMGDDEDEQPLNEMNQAIASRRNLQRAQQLKKIRDARRRLAQDPEDFGYCLECDMPMERARLEAVPYALHCVECQTLLEGPLRHRRNKITDYI
jgi:DnaK suppressor protein